MRQIDKSKDALIVEGSDDQYVIANLVNRRWDGLLEPPSARLILPPRPPKRGERGAYDAAVTQFGSEVRAAKRERIGLVLDFDSTADERWAWVRKRMTADFGVQRMPESLDTAGIVFTDAVSGTRCGVWLMPDNQREGALEDFLVELMPSPAPLTDWARVAADVARREKGAAFTEAAELKAVLRTWLAWQAQPGLPPGTAIDRGLLSSQSPSADRFLAWFERLFLQP